MGVDLINLHLAGRDGSQIHTNHPLAHALYSLTVQYVSRGVQDQRPGVQGKWFAPEINMFVLGGFGSGVHSECIQ